MMNAHLFIFTKGREQGNDCRLLDDTPPILAIG